MTNRYKNGKLILITLAFILLSKYSSFSQTGEIKANSTITIKSSRSIGSIFELKDDPAQLKALKQRRLLDQGEKSKEKNETNYITGKSSMNGALLRFYDARINPIKVNKPAQIQDTTLSKLTSKSPSYNFMVPHTNGADPYDPQEAAGPNHIVAISNCDFSILRKTDGAVIQNISTGTFFGLGYTTDPRIFYDPYENRFVAIMLGEELVTNNNLLAIAVSNNSDPAQGWQFFYDYANQNHSCGLDYPLLGFNHNWIAIAFGNGCGNNLRVIEKLPLYSGTFVSHYFNTPDKLQLTFTYDNSMGDLYGAFTGDHSNNDIATSVVTYKITGSVNAPSVMPSFIYAINNSPWYYDPHPNPGCHTGPPNCGYYPPQLGTNNQQGYGGGGIPSNLVYRNGFLYFAHGICLPPTDTSKRTSIQWWKVNPSTGVIIQVNRIDDPTNKIFVHYPSIAVNKLNDVAIGYCVASANTYYSAGYSFYDAAGNYGSLNYKMGGNFYTGNRWGDFGQTSVDPSDDISVWTINQIMGPNERESWVALIPQYSGCSAGLNLLNVTYNGNKKDESSGTITSQEMISGSSIVDYDAGVNIILQPGFRAFNGTKFHAYIDGCGGAISQNSQNQYKSKIVDKAEDNLLYAVPNPFSNKTTINYTLMEDQAVDLKIYNLQMQLITTLISMQKQQKGKHSIEFIATNIPQGIYICRLQTERTSFTIKLVLAK